jgi:DNA invertase Pin-like site-specific DNA recombinase
MGARIFSRKKESSGKSDLPELKAAQDYLREFDTLNVTKLDRLAHSTFDHHGSQST